MDMKQDLGPRVSDTRPAAFPSNATPLIGRYIILEALRRDHIPSLFSNFGLPNDKSVFNWLPFTDPTNTENELWELFAKVQNDRGFVIYVIKGNFDHLNPGSDGARIDRHGISEALGTIGYLDINPQYRTLEVGAVLFGQALRRTVAATEAFYLILRNVCEPRDSLPYRRIAWKCNNLNSASRRAAERLGYVYEGTLRNHMISKGASRDSDFLSILDDEWPAIKQAFEQWLDDGNFDEKGRQLQTIDQIRAKLLKTHVV